MKMKLISLSLTCKDSLETIDFTQQITYFHGKISSGKSSILRLIDFCLGGELEMTPAISAQLVSVRLSANIGAYSVLFERQRGSNQIRVAWKDEAGNTASVLAPKDATPQSIWGDNVHNLSDLIFHLSELTPIKVRKSKQDETSALVRLSFRDIMWYCYLDQDHLDSQFFRLRDPFRQYKSRDSMRFFTGYYSERMNEIEGLLDQYRSERAANLEAAEQIRTFLQEFGFGSELDVEESIRKVGTELNHELTLRATERINYKTGTHFADELRDRLRQLSDELAKEKNTLSDLGMRIEEQESLKAELITAKFKLTRVESSSDILSGVSFESCPACGMHLDETDPELNTCYLCGKVPQKLDMNLAEQSEYIQNDLNARIDDLTESIRRHNLEKKKQIRIVSNVENRKQELDSELNSMLSEYDSSYLQANREMERRIATLQERKENLNTMLKIPEAISKLEKEADYLRIEEDRLKISLEEEKGEQVKSEELVKEIEKAYLEALLRVKVPGIDKQDKIYLNRNTWLPWIQPYEGDAYNFYNAGSGGKKTLLNVCYALAVHKVARINDMPLPTFLMIDTPMKNIGEDVNEEIFHSFYTYLYELASSSLWNVQFIIIDKEYVPPEKTSGIKIKDRYMSPDDPLITSYRGP